MRKEGYGLTTENTEDFDEAGAGTATNRNTPLSDALLVICALASMSIIALSFMTWMDITFLEKVGEDTLTGTFHASGTDADAFTTIGDGYLTAAFGVVSIALVIAYRLARQWAFYCAAGLAVAALCTAGIGLYNLAYNRTDTGTGAFGITVQVDVTRTAALWGLTLLAILVAVAALSLMAIAWRRVAQAAEADELT